MTNLPFVFSKYIQFVNILIFFVQSKFTRQGKRNWQKWKTMELFVVSYTKQPHCRLLFLCGPALQYLILDYLAWSDSKCRYLPWMGYRLPPLPSPPPRFCRVSLTFYRYPFKLLGEERHALCKLSVFPHITMQASRPRVQSTNWPNAMCLS